MENFLRERNEINGCRKIFEMSGLYLSGAGKKIFVPIIETALPDQGTLLERNFFPEAGKPLSRNYRDFAGAAWALSRISLMLVWNPCCHLLADTGC